MLNQYSSNKEIDSLKKLLKSKCDDQNKVDKIADCLNKINSPDYLDKGMKIFSIMVKTVILTTKSLILFHFKI